MPIDQTTSLRDKLSHKLLQKKEVEAMVATYVQANTGESVYLDLWQHIVKDSPDSYDRVYSRNALTMTSAILDALSAVDRDNFIANMGERLHSAESDEIKSEEKVSELFWHDDHQQLKQFLRKHADCVGNLCKQDADFFNRLLAYREIDCVLPVVASLLRDMQSAAGDEYAGLAQLLANNTAFWRNAERKEVDLNVNTDNAYLSARATLRRERKGIRQFVFSQKAISDELAYMIASDDKLWRQLNPDSYYSFVRSLLHKLFGLFKKNFAEKTTLEKLNPYFKEKLAGESIISKPINKSLRKGSSSMSGRSSDSASELSRLSGSETPDDDYIAGRDTLERVDHVSADISPILRARMAGVVVGEHATPKSSPFVSKAHQVVPWQYGLTLWGKGNIPSGTPVNECKSDNAVGAVAAVALYVRQDNANIFDFIAFIAEGNTNETLLVQEGYSRVNADGSTISNAAPTFTYTPGSSTTPLAKVYQSSPDTSGSGSIIATSVGSMNYQHSDMATQVLSVQGSSATPVAGDFKVSPSSDTPCAASTYSNTNTPCAASLPTMSTQGSHPVTPIAALDSEEKVLWLEGKAAAIYVKKAAKAHDGLSCIFYAMLDDLNKSKVPDGYVKVQFGRNRNVEAIIADFLREHKRNAGSNVGTSAHTTPTARW